MSYQDGWQALNLQRPGRVPRTEYSAERHWPLVQAVTGITVSAASEPSLQDRASAAFRRAWNYDLVWSIAIGREQFGENYTEMGHAVYEQGGADFTAVGNPLLQDAEQALRFSPQEVFGLPERRSLVQRFNSHYREKCATTPDAVNMTGIYITLISGLVYLLGWDMLLLAAGTDAGRFGDLANRYSAWMQAYFDALAESDAAVVMVHDDFVWSSGPFLHPDWLARYLFPNYRKMLAPLRQAGKIILFTADGDYSMFIDHLADCGINGLVMEPFTDMQQVAAHYGHRLSFIGNADTRVLLSGTRQQIRQEVERCMAIGKPCPGFIMAVGNHIPANTPVENALYYNSVYEELSKRS